MKNLALTLVSLRFTACWWYVVKALKKRMNDMAGADNAVWDGDSKMPHLLR
jgi:hypothetical protein